LTVALAFNHAGEADRTDCPELRQVLQMQPSAPSSSRDATWPSRPQPATDGNATAVGDALNAAVAVRLERGRQWLIQLVYPFRQK
jgi:hypothetical protein